MYEGGRPNPQKGKVILACKDLVRGVLRPYPIAATAAQMTTSLTLTPQVRIRAYYVITEV